MKNTYNGQERRKFIRLDYMSPVGFKVCKKKTVSKLLEGYTADISSSGLLCKVKEKVKINDILWLSFDRATLGICEELEKRAFVYQNGIIGKVVRVLAKSQNNYDVGIQFITREEENLTHIHSRLYFLEKALMK